MGRFSSILIVYFLLGAVMWGGGALDWSEAGVGQYIIDDPATDTVSQNASDDLESLGGPIQNVTGTLGGGLIAIWNLMAKFLAYLFWPVTALQAAGAPSRVVVTAGGGVSMAFIAAFIRTIRGSA